jgi:hypothetical protein
VHPRTGGERLVAFYEGRGPDDRGRFLEHVLAASDSWLEAEHDYIQWLFPLRERSGAVPSSPVLDGPAIAAFRARADLRAALRRALDRMLAFYGFVRNDTTIVPGDAFAERSRVWLMPVSHNYLRLTRIITSLRLLGDDAGAQALFACLQTIADDERRSGRNRIPQRTLHFWTRAAEDPRD